MDWDGIDDKLAALGETAANAARRHFRHEMAKAMAHSESPIEIAFLGGLLVIADIGRAVGLFPRVQVRADYSPKMVRSEHGLIIFQQARIGEYRADFLLDYVSNAKDRELMVVECDGHEFHERTKEQAAHDRQRDRTMVAHDLKVMRFTGSEIWADPVRCAQEALMAISAPRMPPGLR